MCCGNSFCQQLWGTSLRAWLLCVGMISYKEEEGLSCPYLAGRNRSKLYGCSYLLGQNGS